ncbi:MAG TPA: WXG100 family type VII secretion target [Streptosporangiaceae bacterium]|jgi:WXG100 family type VII secretion target|nr:WXG100 family type VII secretion target [Streptosporangiaceae bacterium]
MADSDYTMAQFGALQAGEENFKAIYSQVLQTVETLDNQLRSQLAEWNGSAQQAYYAAKSQWDAAMANMQGVLLNLQGVASEASQRYPMVEAQNSALWQ